MICSGHCYSKRSAPVIFLVNAADGKRAVFTGDFILQKLKVVDCDIAFIECNDIAVFQVVQHTVDHLPACGAKIGDFRVRQSEIDEYFVIAPECPVCIGHSDECGEKGTLFPVQHEVTQPALMLHIFSLEPFYIFEH